MSSPMGLTPQQEQELKRLQALYQQAQAIKTQIAQLEAEIAEMKNALKETEKLPEDTPIYKSVGSLLFRVNLKETVEKLKEDIELREVRLKSLKDKDETLTKQIEELQAKLTKQLG